MSPKFRGDADDWLDEEEGTGARARKPGGGRASTISAERANATVAEVFPNQCTVLMDDGRELACAYRRSAVMGRGEGRDGDTSRERSPVAVGDRVLADPLQSEPGAAVMLGVTKRRNALERPAPGRDRDKDGRYMKHVIAANVDVLVIVASSHEPEFPEGLVDRYLIAAQKNSIEPLICVTKADLLDAGSDPAVHPWDKYRKLGFRVREVSAKTGLGIQELKAELEGGRAVFAGQSGVGKTSLLSSLLNRNVGRTTEVNPMTGKGRHTTTSAVLLRPSPWIDTPGVREFGLLEVTPEELPGFFHEFDALKCTGSGCMHRDESDCEARSLARYPSYRRILDSLLSGEY